MCFKGILAIWALRDSQMDFISCPSSLLSLFHQVSCSKVLEIPALKPSFALKGYFGNLAVFTFNLSYSPYYLFLEPGTHPVGLGSSLPSKMVPGVFLSF